MNADSLQSTIDRVKGGRLSRRGFIGRMAVVGLTARVANQLLGHVGPAQLVHAGNKPDIA